VLPFDLFVKAYFFALDLVRILSLLLLDFLGQLLLKFFNGLDQALQFIIHWGLILMSMKREQNKVFCALFCAGLVWGTDKVCLDFIC